jgi:pyrophosphatase PpaX
MVYSAAIVDLDGTLVRTQFSVVHEMMDAILAELGVQKKDDKTYDKFWFDAKTREETIRNRFGVDPDRYWNVHGKHNHRIIKNIELFGDVEVLRTLKEAGFKIAAFSGAPLAHIKKYVQLIGPEVFDFYVRADAENGIAAKPSPDGVLRCLELMGKKPEEAIGIGNGPEDDEAYRRAGVLSVIVDRGEYVFEEFQPKITIKSLHDLQTLGLIG